MLRKKLTREEVGRHNLFMLSLEIASKTIGFDLASVKPQNLTDNEFTVVVKPKTDDKKTLDTE